MTTNEEFAKNYLKVSNTEQSETHFKFVTERKIALTLPIIINDNLHTDNGDIATNVKVVDYDKMFRVEEGYRDKLVNILSKAENLNTLSDLSSEDQNVLFNLIDKLEPEQLSKYAVAVDEVEQDAIKQVIDTDIVLINQIRSDIVTEGMIDLLT
jgi:hypothetical protein